MGVFKVHCPNISSHNQYLEAVKGPNRAQVTARPCGSGQYDDSQKGVIYNSYHAALLRLLTHVQVLLTRHHLCLGLVVSVVAFLY